MHGRGVAALWRRGPSSVRAVDDISVRVRQGFTMGIVGESGCGKTTFARCIAGLEEANCGEIVLEGEPLAFSVSRPAAVGSAQDPDGLSEPGRLAEPATPRGRERRAPAVAAGQCAQGRS